jgi:hypothetical protein
MDDRYTPDDTEAAMLPTLDGEEGPTVDRSILLKEVANGLPHERRRLAEAIENQAFYDLDAERYIPRREAESEFDWTARPHESCGFTQEVIDVLCEHQYSPGPSRQVADNPAADEYIQAIYERNHVDAIFQQAEVLSTLNDVAAIEIVATNDPENPVDLRLWGGEEFAVFVDPDNPKKPVAVVTIDRVNEQTRYRIWFPDVVHTFLTEAYSSDKTNGGRLATEQSYSPEVNTYGCLPFVFVPYRFQVRRFWTPGIGGFLRRGECRINALLSEIDEIIQKYGPAILAAINVAPEINPAVEPGRWIRLFSDALGYNGEGGDGDRTPDLKVVQAALNVAEIWTHIEKRCDQILETVRVPRAAVRMEQDGMASGISLIVEQAPLLTRARNRRKLFVTVETDLARKLLWCCGNHYDRPEFLEAAKTLRFLVGWSEPSIPVPGPERDASDEWEIGARIKSRIQVAMERKGIASREQAIAYLKQVAADETELDVIAPPPVDPNAPDGEPVDETKDETK